jgi:hypothetical protein
LLGAKRTSNSKRCGYPVSAILPFPPLSLPSPTAAAYISPWDLAM